MLVIGADENFFRELSEATIEEYVARVRPTDRAGAYDIDESGDLIVESYSGSYENIEAPRFFRSWLGACPKWVR